MEKIRIKDIAEKAGVSPTTVSNVIHGNTKKVSKETVSKIQTMLQEMAYVPSMSARMLAENRSRIIGVLVGGKADKRHRAQGDSFVNLLISSLEHEIYSRNYYMMFHLSNTAEEHLQLAATWNVEGLITIGLNSGDNLKIQSRCPAPVVSIDNYYKKESIANIGLDDFGGGAVMGQFFLQRGMKKTLFLADNDVGVDHLRWLGFQKAYKERGEMCDERSHIVFPEEFIERGKFYDQNWTSLLKQDALFYASDYYALEAMNYLQDKGIRIPEDISVAGFDDSEYAQIARPLLTSVYQDVREKGIAAVEMLFAFIEGKKQVSMSRQLPVKLVVRDSVGIKKNCSL